MRTKLYVIAAIIGLFVIVFPAAPHHSFAAEFDANKPVTVKGTVSGPRSCRTGLSGPSSAALIVLPLRVTTCTSPPVFLWGRQ